MKLLIIDGNSIINRAFFGMHPLTNAKGQPTHAVFGFLSILRRMETDTDADGICVTFDRSEPTFRHIAYAPYKAQREGMPDDLAVQLPMLKQVLDAMNIPRFELAGWEADDLIGTISRRCEAEGWDCRIVTGDRDSLQLVTPHTYVELVTTRMGKTTTKEYDPAVFEAEYGFPPKGIIDLKSLMGDSSDNIPGVKGVGEKTAMPLIQTCGSLQAVYEQLDAGTLGAKPGVLKKLTAEREMAFKSYELCTIRCDAPIDITPADMAGKPVNRTLLRELFLEFGFRKLIRDMGLEQEEDAPTAASDSALPPEAPAERITDNARAAELLDSWSAGETPVALLALPDLSVIAACRGKETPVLLEETELPGCYEMLLQGLLSAGVPKAAHGSKAIMRAALERGLTAENFTFDTEIAAYLLSPTDGSYELDKTGMKYFSRILPPEKDYRSPRAWSTPEGREKALAAMASHAAVIAALAETLPEQLRELGLDTLCYTLEMPLCPVLAEMEMAGMLIDRGALERFGTHVKTSVAVLEEQLYALAGHPFNPNSTRQLGELLFEELGLPPVKKTKTGYSTSAEVLEKLRGQHPIIDTILEYRQMSKLASTYVDGLSREIAPDGRIHTCFQNTVTATGRLSSTEPNLQNIPVRTELGARIREMFVAAPGNVLVDADYSQIELRLLAHMAGDARMIESFRSGEDFHARTAAQVFGVPPEEVTHELRRRAKAVNFGIVYGISGFSLAQDIGVTRKEAQDYMDRYFAVFSGVRQYMDNIREQAKRDGYVTTLMGRRRWLPELKSSNFNIRSFGERVALNMPIQGTAADVMKLAMLRVSARLKKEGLKARLLLQVHDELIVECPEAEAEQVKQLLEEEMAGAARFAVPLLAEAGVGRSWAEAKQ